MIHFLDSFSLILNWSYAFVFFWILCTFIPPRGGWPFRILSFYLNSIFAFVIVYSNDLPNLLGALVGFAIYIFLFHRGKWTEKIAAVLVFYPAVIAVNYLVQDMGSRLFFAYTGAPPDQDLGWTQEIYLISTAIHTVSMLVRLLFWIFAWLFLKKYLHQITSNLTTRMWMIVNTLMLASFVAIFTIIYFLPEQMVVVYPICVASIFSSFGCIYLAAYICNSVQTAYYAQELERKQAYFKDRMREEERVRSIYHDMKNHLLVLQAQSVPTQEMSQSVQALQEQIEAYENYYHTGNDYLDVIIRDKSRLAREKQIDFYAAIQFEEGAFLEPLDISTIFGNALDNAIEASEKLPKSMRLITIKASRIYDMLVISVENNMRLEALTSERTSKKDTFLHGFGISNIQKVVQKYEGQCIAKPRDEKFILKIVLPIPII